MVLFLICCIASYAAGIVTMWKVNKKVTIIKK
jgi:hypothetical protein